MRADVIALSSVMYGLSEARPKKMCGIKLR